MLRSITTRGASLARHSRVVHTTSAARDLVSPSKLSVRSMGMASSPLDFQEIADEPLNPLYETAQSALDKSCYTTIDWKISEDSMVIDAIHRMVANDIGALAVTHKVHGDVIGVISERDYLNKVVFLGKSSKTTSVSEIGTMMAANMVTVSRGNPIDRCMEKMIDNNCRHLLVRDEKAHDSEIVGMISVKDIVKCTLMKHKAQIQHMKDIVTQQNQMSGL